MKDELLQKQLQRANAPLLANAIELGAQALNNIAGNAISNAVDGQTITPSFLHSALAARVQTLITNNVRTGV